MQSLEPEGFTLSYGHDISLTQPDRFSSPPNPCTNCMFDHAQIFGTILFESFEVDPQETWISKQIHNSRSCTPRDIFKIAWVRLRSQLLPIASNQPNPRVFSIFLRTCERLLWPILGKSFRRHQWSHSSTSRLLSQKNWINGLNFIFTVHLLARRSPTAWSFMRRRPQNIIKAIQMNPSLASFLQFFSCG